MTEITHAMQAALRETFVQRDHELRERALRLVAPPRPPDGEKSRNSAAVESWHHGQTLGAALWRLLDRLDGAPSLEEFESRSSSISRRRCSPATARRSPTSPTTPRTTALRPRRRRPGRSPLG